MKRSASDRTIAWEGGLDDGRLALIDRSGSSSRRLKLRDLEGVCHAIHERAVTADSAIAVAGSYGAILHLIPRAMAATGRASNFLGRHLDEAGVRLTAVAPRDVLLQLAIERLRACLRRHVGQLTAIEMCARLLMEAKRIQREHDGLIAKAQPKKA